ARSAASSRAPAAGLPKMSVHALNPGAPAWAMSCPWSTTAYSVIPRFANSCRSASTASWGGRPTATRSYTLATIRAAGIERVRAGTLGPMTRRVAVVLAAALVVVVGVAAFLLLRGGDTPAPPKASPAVDPLAFMPADADVEFDLDTAVPAVAVAAAE